MALNEQPREDLLREAVQFPSRLLWRYQRSAKDRENTPIGEVFVGIRRNGGWSLYLDEECVLQFNAEQELRRVYWHGQKLAANRGRLESLTRLSRGGRVQLQRLPLAADRQDELLADCQRLLLQFVQLHKAGSFILEGQVPPRDTLADLESDCLHKIQAVSRNILVARTARA